MGLGTCQAVRRGRHPRIQDQRQTDTRRICQLRQICKDHLPPTAILRRRRFGEVNLETCYHAWHRQPG